LPEYTSDCHLRDHRRGTRRSGTLRQALYGGCRRRPEGGRRAPRQLQRLLSATIPVGSSAKTVGNIGAVIGVFPITGVADALVSTGAVVVLVTMLGLGMLRSFERRDQGREGLGR